MFLNIIYVSKYVAMFLNLYFKVTVFLCIFILYVTLFELFYLLFLLIYLCFFLFHLYFYASMHHCVYVSMFLCIYTSIYLSFHKSQGISVSIYISLDKSNLYLITSIAIALLLRWRLLLSANTLWLPPTSRLLL